MPRPRPCRGGRNGPGCGQAIVLVQTQKGGVIPLEPYPVPPKEASRHALRVDVQPHGLVLLGRNQPSSTRTKLYERHVCVTAATAVPPPHKRSEQLDLLGGEGS